MEDSTTPQIFFQEIDSNILLFGGRICVLLEMDRQMTKVDIWNLRRKVDNGRSTFFLAPYMVRVETSFMKFSTLFKLYIKKIAR